jgi:hypothetical protein
MQCVCRAKHRVEGCVSVRGEGPAEYFAMNPKVSFNDDISKLSPEEMGGGEREKPT